MEYATSNGTAAAGSDYPSTSGTLTFTQASAGAKTFTVQTTEDTVDELAETFSVSISNPIGGGGPAPSLGRASVSTTIIDGADADSPENVVVQSAYYGLGVSRVGWSTPSGISPTGYVVEWREDITGEVKQSTTLGNGARSYDIAGKLLASWVRVGAVTPEGVNWSAAVFLPDDPLQAWFIDDTPGINRDSSPNRLNFILDANQPAVSGKCTVKGLDIEVSDINCTPEILATFDYDPDAFGDTVSITGRTSAGSETAWHPVEWVNYGPSAPWAWVSGGNGNLLVGWNVPAESGSGSINGYMVQLRSRNADGSWSGWTDTEKAADARSHTFTGLADGTYQVRVQARNDNNGIDPDTHTLGVTSEVRTVAVAAAITNLPGAPTGVAVTPGAGKLALKWQPPARERGSLVHLYTVRYKASDADSYNEITVHPRTGINTCSKLDADGGSLWDEDPGCREVEITGLDSGTEYMMQIRTHNAVGVSQWTTIGNTHRPN